MAFKMKGWSAFTKKTDGKGDEHGVGSDHGANNKTEPGDDQTREQQQPTPAHDPSKESDPVENNERGNLSGEEIQKESVRSLEELEKDHNKAARKTEGSRLRQGIRRKI